MKQILIPMIAGMLVAHTARSWGKKMACVILCQPSAQGGGRFEEVRLHDERGYQRCYRDRRSATCF